jgi:hypothetical protein
MALPHNFDSGAPHHREAKKGAHLHPVTAMPHKKTAPAAKMHPIKKGK